MQHDPCFPRGRRGFLHTSEKDLHTGKLCGIMKMLDAMDEVEMEIVKTKN
jgi:hypothetical protein